MMVGVQARDAYPTVLAANRTLAEEDYGRERYPRTITPFRMKRPYGLPTPQ